MLTILSTVFIVIWSVPILEIVAFRGQLSLLLKKYQICWKDGQVINLCYGGVVMLFTDCIIYIFLPIVIL